MGRKSSRGNLLITNLKITRETFDTLAAYQSSSDSGLDWNLVFTLPGWLKVWWQNFHSGAELYLKAVRQEGKITGIAPLQIKNGIASIIGSVNICDYHDFILSPGNEINFFNILLDDLNRQGIRGLHLETIRPDSTIIRSLVPLAEELQLKVSTQQTDVSFEIDLPPTWEEYLIHLERKQRHELKRKIRNVHEFGETNYRVIEDKDAIIKAMDNFLKLFPEARKDKAQFMTREMEAFFRMLAAALANIGVIKFGLLESGDKSLAMVLYFDYNNNVYLYNSAYDPTYKSMSIGIVSKARCIQDSIGKGKRKFDFLKGGEPYKSYLGGKEIPLYSCDITF
jgi:CelD/BcsL family acetyltransferase involved in cellulose biosynthesis